MTVQKCHPLTWIAVAILIVSVLSLIPTIKCLIINFNHRYHKNICQINNCTSIQRTCVKTNCVFRSCSKINVSCFIVSFNLIFNGSQNISANFTEIYYDEPTICQSTTTTCYIYKSNIFTEIPVNTAGSIVSSIIGFIIICCIITLGVCIYRSIQVSTTGNYESI